MKPPAREVLTVFWDGEETPGLTFYGLRARGESELPEFPLHDWKNAECLSWRLHGEAWEVAVWVVRVDRWPAPDRFRSLSHLTMEALLEAGCVVSWVGREGFFIDPPDLFLPESMSKGVLSALSRATGFRTALELDQPMRSLLDDELLELREASGGLAAAS